MMGDIPAFLDRRTKKALSADLMACGVSITKDNGDGTVERVAPEEVFLPPSPIRFDCYDCNRCDRGAKPCVQGTPIHCTYPFPAREREAARKPAPMKPRRISMGCYAIERGDRSVVIQREGRRGFKIVMRKGAMSPHFKRLRDAVATAVDSLNPWPFPVDPQQ